MFIQKEKIPRPMKQQHPTPTRERDEFPFFQKHLAHHELLAYGTGQFPLNPTLLSPLAFLNDRNTQIKIHQPLDPEETISANGTHRIRTCGISQDKQIAIASKKITILIKWKYPERATVRLDSSLHDPSLVIPQFKIAKFFVGT